MSSDRTIQITQRADFPPPTDTPGIGSAWFIKDVTAWAERTGRTLQWDALTGEISVDRPSARRRPGRRAAVAHGQMNEDRCPSIDCSPRRSSVGVEPVAVPPVLPSPKFVAADTRCDTEENRVAPYMM